MKPYPSLSFVEYNSSQEAFFTPLVYFLAGHYLDPWDAGEGGLKNGVIFWFFLFGASVSKFACFVLLKNLKTYGFDFGFLSFVVGFLWVNHCGHLGPLETFLRGLCCQKYWKTHVLFNVFLRMLLLGFLMPLMGVLSHLLLSLAGFHPPWLPKWDSKRFQTVIKN